MMNVTSNIFLTAFWCTYISCTGNNSVCHLNIFAFDFYGVCSCVENLGAGYQLEVMWSFLLPAIMFSPTPRQEREREKGLNTVDSVRNVLFLHILVAK